ncbi:hypothetical protein Tsubulata_051500, partial [Turnera subulata]
LLAQTPQGFYFWSLLDRRAEQSSSRHLLISNNSNMDQDCLNSTGNRCCPRSFRLPLLLLPKAPMLSTDHLLQ